MTIETQQKAQKDDEQQRETVVCFLSSLFQSDLELDCGGSKSEQPFGLVS